MPTGIYSHKKNQGMFGKKHTEEAKLKMSLSAKNHKPNFLGHIHTEETKEKISKNKKGKNVGEKNGKWIKDRSLIKHQDERNNPEYKQWIKKIKKRDKNICRINNKDCYGYKIVHHILSWSEYPELRHNINNGITLC